MKVLDTTFLIDLLRAKSEKVKLMSDSETVLVTTQINVYEIVSGALYSGSQLELARARSLFENIRILPIDDEAITYAAKIRANLLKSGEIIEDTDCLIAGCALSKGIDTIITKNIKHFKRIKELKVETY